MTLGLLVPEEFLKALRQIHGIHIEILALSETRAVLLRRLTDLTLELRFALCRITRAALLRVLALDVLVDSVEVVFRDPRERGASIKEGNGLLLILGRDVRV